MITTRFRSGEQKSFKAGTTELRDGTLILYTRHRRGLPWRPKFPVDNIEWVRLSNGSVMIEARTVKCGTAETLSFLSRDRKGAVLVSCATCY